MRGRSEFRSHRERRRIARWQWREPSSRNKGVLQNTRHRLTAYGSEQDVERCLKAGFALHLTKPAGADDLRRAIREALDSAEKAAA